MNVINSVLNIKGKALFYLLLIGFFFTNIPLYLIIGIGALFGGNVPFTFNGEQVTGWKGLLICIIFIPLMAVILASVNWLYLSFGLWLYRRSSHLWEKKIDVNSTTNVI